jgi:hypothetical protein
MFMASGVLCAAAGCGALAVTLTSKAPRTKLLALKIFEPTEILDRIVLVPAA